MLLLINTSSKVQVVTGSALQIDVHSDLVDVSSAGAVTESTKNTAITTAATTDVTGSPAASTTRNVKVLNIANKDVSNQTITVQHTDGTTTVQLCTTTLMPGQSLVYMEGVGWATMPLKGGVPLGLTGATAATRYVGGTASGAPTSGTFAVGDFVIDETGHVWICTVAGTPGTWVDPAAAAGPEYGRVTNDVAGVGSMTNITGWSFAIAANEVRSFYGLLWVHRTSGQGGNIQLTGPASPSSVRLTYVLLDSGSTSPIGVAPATAFSSAIGPLGNAAGAGDLSVWVIGTIANGSNAGTVQLQGDATNVATYKAGSFVVATKGS